MEEHVQEEPFRFLCVLVGEVAVLACVRGLRQGGEKFRNEHRFDAVEDLLRSLLAALAIRFDQRLQSLVCLDHACEHFVDRFESSCLEGLVSANVIKFGQLEG